METVGLLQVKINSDKLTLQLVITLLVFKLQACVDIVQSPKLFEMVVPSDQNFGDDYSGIFHFRFWLYGRWVDVVVDDRLPYWPNGKLLFCSNKEQPNEFWCPLLVSPLSYLSLNSIDLHLVFSFKGKSLRQVIHLLTLLS